MAGKVNSAGQEQINDGGRTGKLAPDDAGRAETLRRQVFLDQLVALHHVERQIVRAVLCDDPDLGSLRAGAAGARERQGQPAIITT